MLDSVLPVKHIKYFYQFSNVLNKRTLNLKLHVVFVAVVYSSSRDIFYYAQEDP